MKIVVQYYYLINHHNRLPIRLVARSARSRDTPERNKSAAVRRRIVCVLRIDTTRVVTD